jgi:uncharacterized tellurite resistance protein B-like protein
VNLSSDEATYVLALTMAGADGEISEDEEIEIEERVAHADLEIFMRRREDLRALARSAYDDTGPVLDAINDAFENDETRAKALALAADIIWSDQEIDPGELTGIMELADALDVDRDVVSALLAARKK